MFLNLSLYSGIGNYFLTEKNCFFVLKRSTNEYSEISQLGISEKIRTKEKIIWLKFSCDYLFIEVISLEDGMERTLKYSLIQKKFINDELLVSLMLRGNFNDSKIVALKYDNESNTKIGVYNVNSLYKQANTEHSFFVSNFFLKDHLLVTDKKTIICYLSSSLIKLYNKEIIYKQEFERFIGIFNNELWILLANNCFLVLDVNTGKELFYIENLQDILCLNTLAIGDLFLDEQRKIIKIFAYSYYIEINVETRIAEIKKEFDTGWGIGKAKFYSSDDFAYFCGRNNNTAKKTIGNNIAGIFNTLTYKVEWYYTLEVDEKFNFFIDTPQANDNYFGIKDNNENLFLFKR